MLSTILPMKRALLFTLSSLTIVLGGLFLEVNRAHAAYDPEDAVSFQTKQQNNAADNKANATQTAYVLGDGYLSYILTKMSGCITEKCKNSPLTADSGAIGGVARMIASTYQPAASVETYIADITGNMGFAEPAYAQGLGFSALQPVLQLWKLFRDIAYVFFVFLFLIIGFAIMFRKNLGGQTAVTVQQALPRIVVALLAVSFSYAIAGLVIDLMWVVMYFLITMFASANLIPDLTKDYSILGENIFGVFGRVISSNFSADAGKAIGETVYNMFNATNIIDQAGQTGLSWISGVLAMIIIFVAILFAMFRTFFALIKVYFEIILSIIFAPIILMMGAVNGNAFGNWLKGLIANLAVFPALLVFVLIGFMLIDTGTSNLPKNLDENGFVPPFVPGRGTASTVGLIGGIAAIMLLPEVVNIVGKFKPASIFDEFGGKAINNVFTGNQLAAPLALGAGAGAYGAVRGGLSAYRQAGTSGGIRAIMTGITKGSTVGDKTYGGLRPLAGTGWSAGRKVARLIDRAKSGEALDPNIYTSQLDEIAKAQQELARKAGGDHGSSNKSSSESGGDDKSGG